SIAATWHPDLNRDVWDDVPGREAAVVPEVDPVPDLVKRTQRWSYPLGRGDLADLALFAAALAKTEGEAWASGNRSLATQAFEERRYLAADRILPWAVPWLRALARCFPERRTDGEAAVEALLAIGERHRPAPMLTGAEGLSLPGHDGYGPVDGSPTVSERVGSLWGGLVVFRRTLESITGEPSSDRSIRSDWLDDPAFSATVSTLYEVAAARWDGLVDRRPGTARYWSDLALRATVTAELAR
ncbi:MAG: hypothetical protein U9N84_06025, partial [Actinomycetota bacterium]|nr:hypothetical protein [Actinomycetota bacterium]